MSDYPSTPQWIVEMRAEQQRLLAERQLRARWAKMAERGQG